MWYKVIGRRIGGVFSENNYYGSFNTVKVLEVPFLWYRSSVSLFLSLSTDNE